MVDVNFPFIMILKYEIKNLMNLYETLSLI